MLREVSWRLPHEKANTVDGFFVGKTAVDTQQAFFSLELIVIDNISPLATRICNEPLVVLVVKFNCRDAAAVRLPSDGNSSDDGLLREDQRPEAV